MKKFLLIYVMLLMLPWVCNAQNVVKEHEPVKVYFRQGSSSLDPTYMGNQESLDSLTSLLQPYILNNEMVKGRVQIVASASPEGGAITNNRLIETRSRRIADWISNRFKVEVGYEVDLMGVDWASLLSMAEQSSDLPNQADVLNILKNVPESERQSQLEKLHNGVPYRWMAARLYPRLRYAAVRTEVWYASEIRITSPSPLRFQASGGEGVITFEKNVEDKIVPSVSCDAAWVTDIVPTGKDITFKVAPNPNTSPRKAVVRINCYGNTYEVEVHQEAAEPEPVIEPEPVVEPGPIVDEPECTRPLFMSISNNALYDILLIPNIGAEIYLGKDWSLDANWHYSWWKSDTRHRYWRTYGGDLNIRKWFGTKAMLKPLTGHHIGLYGQMITYDFEFGGKGYLADRWSWAAGVEYGYSMPIARRLNLDFSIGIGYHWGEYDEYIPIDNHYVWQATKNRKFFGPTKAEVSLVWLIGCGNYNQKKGGNR